MSSWRHRESQKQARCRQANEATAARPSAGPRGPGVRSFVCECGDRGCTCAIDLTLAEYESVRSYATHFALARNHENPESELVVEENERFAVVQTISRDGVKLARRSDPRSAGAGRRGAGGT
jgi:hypothetical protein